MDNNILFTIAFGVIVGWIILVIGFVGFLLKKYTFKKWTNGETNPYEKESLGMPRGMIRGILALSVLFIVLLLESASLFSLDFNLIAMVNGDPNAINPELHFDKLMTTFQMIIAFYFGGKVMHHMTTSKRKSSEIIREDTIDQAVKNALFKKNELEEKDVVG